MDGHLTMTGPLFDGRAEAEAEAAARAIRQGVSKRGQSLTAAAFNASIRDNRGTFIESITITDTSRTYSTTGGRTTYTLSVDVPAEAEVVTTDLATYGPWLEGVGSRNETTRFKGYQGFRRASQELDGQAQAISEGIITPFVERMN